MVEVRAHRPGEALLRDGAGAVWRLAWAAPGSRRFAVPAGRYRWCTYRLVAGEWHVSVTGELADVDVARDAPCRLEVRDGIALEVRGAPREGAVQARVNVGGPAGGGLSLYRDGRRVGLTCVLVGPAGDDVGTGPLTYG